MGARMRVMIVGVSTRALAESAVRAGHACASVDAFGDLDQRRLVANRALGRDLGRRYSAAAAVALARETRTEAAAYVANLENHPAAVRRLADGRRLLGNPPEAVVAARDPGRVAGVIRAAGGRFPTTLAPREAPGADPRRAWIRKPARGGGGSGVVPWRPGAEVGARELLQERVSGVLASVAFLADGRRAVVLGLSRQLAGDPAFAAQGFRYCGSLFPLAHGGALRERVQALAEATTAAFGLRGVNGIDFVLRDGEPHVLELNPRYTASMELVERASGASTFDLHARACHGELPDPAPPPAITHGKAILFARRDLVLGDTLRWLDRDDIRDVPFPGDRIARGHPICTLFARGASPEICYARLVEAAAALEREIYGRGDDHPDPA